MTYVIESIDVGVVASHRPGNSQDRVTGELDWDTEGVLTKAGAALGFDDRADRGERRHVTQFIERTDGATSAWRGDITRTVN